MKDRTNKMRVFMIARGGLAKINLKLNRQFDADLVGMAVGWLLQEQGQRDEGKPPITELKATIPGSSDGR